MAGDYPKIIDNVVTENTGYGIMLDAPYSTGSITGNQIISNGDTLYTDVAVVAGTPNISFNVYNDITGDSGVGLYNVKSDGTAAPIP